MKSTSQHLIGINLGLLAISTSGVFGRTLTLAPEVAIFWRCAFALVIMGIYLKVRGANLRIIAGDGRIIILGGILMGIHWVTYFYSLSLANVAIAILTLHTFPAMTTILEPLILKTKFRAYHLLLATLITVGIYIIAPSFDMSDGVFLAIIFGLISALTYALRNILTRKVISRYDGSSMMFFQLCIMSLITIPYLFTKSSAPLISTDWPLILALAAVTTCLGHTLLVQHLKYYSAVTVSLMSSIIPIYGILWPFIFLDEVPTLKTLIGGSLILLSFLIEAIVSSKSKKLVEE